ncbi:dienelactone hydrolase family protein [Microbacterium suwonense]|uniref:Carboxymethylenebutenolidase n=1 Tax=Microbacterium suwonense TaxID=683047 RepID=A0ABM8FWM3_9MICO|nr:dienelactone hydrolase family protein [Microbacterium suwonense]BDZ40089.1 carboxymethylenebutenolidase [Microbacterium suwonense]
MPGITRRDVAYRHGDTTMLGLLASPTDAVESAAVLLIHDAFGLSEDMIAIADELAGGGLVVFAADVWGDRTTPTAQAEIGPLIGAMAGDRPEWQSRISAAVAAAAEQPEIDPERIALLGYCFGGSSALEFLRTGGRARGVIAIHPGLDLLGHDWSAAAASGIQVHVAVGSIDPMATQEQRRQLEDDLTTADADWQIDVYSHTTHAFTSLRSQDSPRPDLFDYHPRNAARAWQSTVRALDEMFPDTAGA